MADASNLQAKDIIPAERGFRLDIYHRPGVSVFHNHGFFEIVYYPRGEGLHVLGEVVHPIDDGSVFLVSPHDHHKVITFATPDIHAYNLAFIPQILDPELPMDVASSPNPVWPAHWKAFMVPAAQRRVPFSKELHEWFLRLFRELEFELADSRMDRDRNIRALFQLIISTINLAYDNNVTSVDPSELRRANDRVRDATDFIDTHCGEAIEVENIAEAVGLSSSRLSHAFKDSMGMTVHQYLQNTRMAEACNLLRHDGVKISDIGHRVGFPDTSHFSRTFKRVIGLSPAEYRDKAIADLGKVNLHSEATYM